MEAVLTSQETDKMKFFDIAAEDLPVIIQKQPLEKFCKTTENGMEWNSFSKKDVILLECDSIIGAFQRILRSFLEHLFRPTASD